MTMKPFEIQSPALSINGVLIDTSAQGKLVIPGVTRAGTYVAIEVEDTGDQTTSWGSIPDVIDGYTYAVEIAQTEQPAIGWTAATYEVNEIDGEGYIDGISIVGDGGTGYSAIPASFCNVMYASTDGTNWTEIPFKVRCGAGEIQSEFGGGGGASALEGLDDVQIDGPSNGQVLTWNSSQEKWENQTPSGGGGNANTGDLLFEANTVYAAGTGFLNLQNPDNQVVIGSNNDSPLKVSVNENNGSKEWLFDTSGNLTLPPGGDIIDTYGNSVLGGGGASSIIGSGSFSTLPDFLDYEPGTLVHAGQTSQGVFFSGNAGGISYPIRTNFSIDPTTKIVVNFDMVVNDSGADFGICIFQDSFQPEWNWGTNPTRIAAQYDGTDPVIEGINSESYANDGIPGAGTYGVRFTYDPNNSPNITLETLDTGTVISTVTADEVFNTPEQYRIGFGADQDRNEYRTYIKNLSIEIFDGSNTVLATYTDSLMLSGGGGGPATALYTQNAGSVTGQQDNVAQGRYNIVIDAEKDVVINTDEDGYQFRFTNNGELKFPDGTLQPTAFNRDTPSHGGGNSPTLYGYGTQANSDSATTIVEGFVAAPRSVLVVASGVETGTGLHATITSITGMGLTWIRRALNIDQRSGSTQQAELWYAVNNTDTDITDDITITFDNTFDDQSTVVTNYLGCDLNNPWTNAGPYTSNSVNGDGYPEVTMNIYESGTLGLLFFAVPDSQTEGDPGYAAGWNGVAYVENNGAEFWEYAALSTNRFTDPQDSLVVVLNRTVDPMNNQSSFGLTMIADALVSAGPGKLDRIINPNTDEILRINDNGDAVLDGPEGGIDRGLRWNYGSNNSGVDSFVRQDDGGLTVQAYSDNFWPDGSPVILRNGDNTQWTFGPGNQLTLPNGTLIGSFDSPDGIDLKATSLHDYAQLNYNEDQYIWTENGGAFIQTNYRSGVDNAKTWIFDKRGQIVFPDGTKQQTAYVQQNINLDGGGAMSHYDVDVAYADGGFSSTRHGVADATFDGGNRLTVNNQFNLDGGGA